MAAIVTPNPPHTPWLVVEVLGTGQLPDNIFGDMSDKFRVTGDDGGGDLIRAAHRSRDP